MVGQAPVIHYEHRVLTRHILIAVTFNTCQASVVVAVSCCETVMRPTAVAGR